MTRFARITGAGSYLPPRRVTSDELTAQLAEKGIKTSDEWIVSRGGIRARHFAEPDVTCSDLVVGATECAVEAAGIDRSELDPILVATSTPGFVFPSTACLVQQKLGITNGCVVFNVQTVCSGFVYALATADKFIRSGAYHNVLVVGSEVFSRITDFTDHTTCVLLGDGADVMVLQASDRPDILSTTLHVDGSHANILCVPGNVATGAIQSSAFPYIDGQAVFKLAVTMLDKVAREALTAAELDASQVDWLIPHQVSIRIMQGTTRKLDLSNECLIVTVDGHGNTSAASIPLVLDVAVCDDRIQRDQHVMLEGTDGGFTQGAALLRS